MCLTKFGSSVINPQHRYVLVNFAVTGVILDTFCEKALVIYCFDFNLTHVILTFTEIKI